MTKYKGYFTVFVLVGAVSLFAQTAQPTDAAASEAQPVAAETAEKAAAQTQPATAEESEGFVAPREEVKEKTAASKQPRVVFNPKTQRDPTLSPDDILLLEYREKQRLAAEEAERKRKLEEERKRLEAEERKRQLELEYAKDPTRAVRNKFTVAGVIGNEFFVGDKLYGVGNTIYGARVVEVHADYVIFSYKGHRFRKNVKL